MKRILKLQQLAVAATDNGPAAISCTSCDSNSCNKPK